MKYWRKKEKKKDNILLPLPESEENEMFAIVDKILGGSRVNVNCDDGKSRLARIPGRKKRRIGRIKIGDLLIISPWGIQDEKADILHKYKRNRARFLSRINALPDEVDVFKEGE